MSAVADPDRVMEVVHLLAFAVGKGHDLDVELLVGLTDAEVAMAERRWAELCSVTAAFYGWRFAQLDYLARHAPLWLTEEQAEAWLSSAQRAEYDAIDPEGQ